MSSLPTDYPYAMDGLEIWSCIVSWVKEYLSLYYENDDAVKFDIELQAWWSEIRNVGHGEFIWVDMSWHEQCKLKKKIVNYP